MVVAAPSLSLSLCVYLPLLRLSLLSLCSLGIMRLHANSQVADLEHKNNILVRAVREVYQRAADFEARNNFLKV